MQTCRVTRMVVFAIVMLTPVWFLWWLAWHDARQQHLNSALFAAIRSEEPDRVEFLLDHGADANAYDVPVANVPLWSLIVRRLTHKTPIPTDYIFSRPLTLALEPTLWDKNNGDMMPYVVSDERKRELQMLQEEVEQNRVRLRMVKALLQHGADANVSDETGASPLLLAGRIRPPVGDLMVEALLDKHADVNTRWGKTGVTALMLAGDIRIAKMLLADKANINAKSSDGYTPLMHVDDPQTALVFLAAGANVKARNSRGETALMYCRDVATAKVLLAAGADVNAESVYGVTALMRTDDPQMVQVLLKAGANVNAKDNNGQTALMTCNDSKILQILIAARANLNIRDSKGCTPLIAAAYRGDAAVVEVLLASGADVNVRSYSGKTALSATEDEKCKGILKAAGAVK
jgi:ankyrin repeat protein